MSSAYALDMKQFYSKFSTGGKYIWYLVFVMVVMVTNFYCGTG